MITYKVSSSEILSDFIPFFIAKLIKDAGIVPADCVFNVEGSLEIHVPSLRNTAPDLCEKIENYWGTCLRFLENPTNIKNTITVSRFISKVTQVDNSTSRIDLSTPYKFLNTVQSLQELLDIILTPYPSLEDLKGFEFFKNLEVNNDVYEFTIEIPGQYLWIKDLGGLPSPVEVARVFVLTVNYAKWRDRKVRRLVSIESRAIEVWPSYLE